ncbi:MAG: NAD-dependent epimerase/dehydratase family protein [Burkholderiales bacterium]|nr:MAG: NAD-dependent epimerase/dehydratase family protein [Burkholderiales bacterium]
MTILVTGATGFLGSALCRELRKRGEPVRAAARALPVGDDGAGIDWRPLDLAGGPDWSALLDGVTTVYHLAWSSIPSSAASAPVQDLTVNVGGLVGLLEAARSYPGIRIVFPSSGGTVYGRPERLPTREDHPKHPLSAYGVAKLAAEAYLDLYRASHGVNSIALRISNPIGPGQNPNKGLGVITHFARAALADQPLPLFGDGRTIRDFVDVADVVEAMIRAGERTDVVGPLNIGAGVGWSLRDVITAMEVHFRRPLAVHERPARAFDVPACVLDIAAAHAQLGWTPRHSFEESLSQLINAMAAG